MVMEWTLGFIAGVSAAGSTVPVGALSPIARDTVLGNIGTTTAAPAAVPLASIDSTSVVYDGTAHELRRAALTGFTDAAANSNATTSAEPIVTYSASSNMSAERVTTSSTSVTVDTSVASQIQFQRAALTGEATAAANANAVTVTRSTNFQTSPWTGNHQFNGEVRLGTLTTTSATGSLNITPDAGTTRILLSGTGTITIGTISGCAEGRVMIIEFTGTGTHTLTHDPSTADAIGCPGNVDLVINGRGGAVLIGRGTSAFNWKVVGVGNDLLQGTNTWTGANTYSNTVSLGQKVLYAGIISPTAISADQNDYNPTGWTTSNFVRLSTNSATQRVLTGAQAGSSGELKWLCNLGPGNIQLDAASTASSASNRWLFVDTTTLTIFTNGMIPIIYDGVSSRWRAMHPQLIT